MARAVICAMRSRRPANSASSSTHSCSIIVESISATSSRLRRPASGWTITSAPAARQPPEAPRATAATPRHRAERRTSAATPGSSQSISTAPTAARASAAQRPRPSAPDRRRRRRRSRHDRQALLTFRSFCRCEERMTRRAILIAGPTASGKSALALAHRPARRRRRGQRRFDAGLSRPAHSHRAPDAGRRGAASAMRCSAMSTPRVNYSVGRWLEDFRRPARQARARGRDAGRRRRHGHVFQGRALRPLRYSAGPGRDPRESPRRSAKGARRSYLHARLAERDPETAARLRPTDPQRILRALEVLEATGQPLASFQGARTAPLLDASGLPRLLPRPAARRALCAHRRAFRRICSAEARSTRCGRWARAGSIPLCRRCARMARRISCASCAASCRSRRRRRRASSTRAIIRSGNSPSRVISCRRSAGSRPGDGGGLERRRIHPRTSAARA